MIDNDVTKKKKKVVPFTLLSDTVYNTNIYSVYNTHLCNYFITN